MHDARLQAERLQERPQADLVSRAAATSASLTAIYRALAAIGRPPHEIAFVSGIGCSSRIPGYTTAYGFNSVHGRALPIAQGIKLANPDLLVLVAGGDGDGFSIGGGHVPHAIRRNIDLTYIVMDNQIYGLTKGQLSPTSPRGLQTVTSPYGSLEDPVNPLLYVLGYGAHFVAQGTPADMVGLAAIIEEGDPLSRLRLRQRAVAVRHLRRAGAAAEGAQAAHEAAREPRPRPGRSHRRRWRWRRTYGQDALHRRLLPQPGAAADLRGAGARAAAAPRARRCRASAFSTSSRSAWRRRERA